VDVTGHLLTWLMPPASVFDHPDLCPPCNGKSRNRHLDGRNQKTKFQFTTVDRMTMNTVMMAGRGDPIA